MGKKVRIFAKKYENLTIFKLIDLCHEFIVTKVIAVKMIPTFVGLRKNKIFNLMNWLSYFFKYSNAFFGAKISEFKFEI